MQKKNVDKNMIIAMSATKEWYHYLLVDLYSMLECTKSIKKIYLLIETTNYNDIPYLNDFKKKYDVEIILVNLNDYLNKFLKDTSPNRNTIFTDFSNGRLLLPEIVSEDRVLYIDVDAIVRKDISNVWNYNISNVYVAGVRDYGVFDDGIIERYNIQGKYINAGFALFNLELIRKDNIFKKWLNIINNLKLVFPDQDALNIVCQHKEMYLPCMYNSAEYAGQRITMETQNKSLIKVYHYAGPKEFWVADRLYCEEWYDAEEKFYNEFGWK